MGACDGVFPVKSKVNRKGALLLHISFMVFLVTTRKRDESKEGTKLWNLPYFVFLWHL